MADATTTVEGKLFLTSPNAQKQNMADAALKHRVNAGTANTGAKLTETQVLEIREAYSKGTSQAELGRRYGVNRSCIYKIVSHTHWSHI